MPKSANKDEFVYQNLLIALGILIVLLLSLTNINVFFSQKAVLGLSVQEVRTNDLQTADEFWKAFLSTNPDYIPGWIELGRFDKAREIDPNFIAP